MLLLQPWAPPTTQPIFTNPPEQKGDGSQQVAGF